jgi:DNA-binding FadR family transcriptional regulator
MSEHRADTLFRELRDALLAGRWDAGERLPSERALAEAHGVNRVTVRAAVGRLVALGLVTVRRGDGIRAAGVRQTGSLDLLSHLLDAAESGELPLDVVRDLLQVRRMVAAEAVALACSRATDEDLRRLRDLAAEQASRAGDPDTFRAGDVAFGRAVLQAAGNLALELLLNTIERFYAARPEVGDALLAEPATPMASYWAVIGLIEHGDGDGARTAVRRALEAVDAAALCRLGADAGADGDAATAGDRGGV